MFEVVDNTPKGAVIKIVGVGGGGGNAVKHMIDKGIEGVEFCAINTDAQDLQKLDTRVTSLQIGQSITQGLGAGSDPKVGQQSAEEDRDNIAALLQGTNMLFIAAGMGGGTGTGAAPVVAEIAKSQNILTIAVATKPFSYENRTQIATEGLAELGKHVDTIIVVSNNKLREVFGSSTTLLDAFSSANDVLFGAVQGVADLITRPGLINVDFADVQTVMLGKGNAMMGTGTATGENRATLAAENALKSPLLEDISLNSAKGLLINVTASDNLRMAEFEEVLELIHANYAAKDAKVVIGTTTDPEMEDSIKVTVVATGVFGSSTSAARPATETQASAPSFAMHSPTNNDHVGLQLSEAPNTDTSVPPVDLSAKDDVPPPAKQSTRDQDWSLFKSQAAFLRRQAN